ncbi:MAG: AI-2E family transporter [Desulfobacterales bacterium]|nr:AI-2E family transporter [Desulfobacterales bacterium]MDD4393110.1 AI-2E family transporter [Desulfobacterales bacterium]
MDKITVHKWVLLLLVLFISALFLSMISQFLMAIFLAGIFSALSLPLYRRFVKGFRGRRRWAAAACILLIVFVVLIPLTGLLGIVTSQAIKVGETARPWVEHQLSEPDNISNFLKTVPFIDRVEPYRNQILTKAGEMVGHVSTFLINRLSSVTLGTVNFLFMLFVMLYAMYFFLLDGDKLIFKILYYLPLEDRDEQRILDRFTSVTRATLKGTAVIGILQGALAGLAFAAAGIPSAVFWGAIMAVLSIIPNIGSAIVWVPAAIILAATGHVAKAIGLALFCAIIVGSMDNLLRPVLVGKDTQMHELMIFLGTLGGIFMFGMVGIITGPIIAALFVTIWDIYGVAFKDILPDITESEPDRPGRNDDK